MTAPVFSPQIKVVRPDDGPTLELVQFINQLLRHIAELEQRIAALEP